MRVEGTYQIQVEMMSVVELRNEEDVSLQRELTVFQFGSQPLEVNI